MCSNAREKLMFTEFKERKNTEPADHTSKSQAQDNRFRISPPRNGISVFSLRLTNGFCTQTFIWRDQNPSRLK